MTKRTRRMTVVAALVLAATSTVAGGAPEAEAHVCAEGRVHVSGSTTPVGSCHDPYCPSDDHVGNATDVTFGGTGAGATVCVGF